MEHELLCADTNFLIKNLAEQIVYQKESWSCFYRQEKGIIYFDPFTEDKFVAYIYFTYLKVYPNAVFDFISTYDENEKKHKIEYVINLHNSRNLSSGLVLFIEEKKFNNEASFVYDIETTSGSFQCGTGSLIVKNTDSIYVNFQDFNIKDSDQQSQVIKKLFTFSKKVERELVEDQLFPPQCKLLLEGLYTTFFILSKKRYMAFSANEDGTISSKLCKRGVVLSRRDNSLFQRQLYEKVVRAIMNRQTFEYIIDDIIASEFCNLFQWDTEHCNINNFVITKTYNEGYKIKALPCDAKKLKKRLLDLEIVDKDEFNSEIFLANHDIKTINEKLVSLKGKYHLENTPSVIQDYIIKSLLPMPN